MAPKKTPQGYTSQYLALDDPFRKPHTFDEQGIIQIVEVGENDIPWILTSMIPEAMGPTENPDNFLPTGLSEPKLDGRTVAAYKARSGEAWKKNPLVAHKIIPMLGLKKEQLTKWSNMLNKRDQDWRYKRGILPPDFQTTRMGKGATERDVPKQVYKAAMKHSEEQWLHRTWGVIDLQGKTYDCEGTHYFLRAPMDLPPRIVELLKAVDKPVPRVRAYLENNMAIWAYFFNDHYKQTMELRQTDPFACLPLPGYIFEDDQGTEEEAEEEEEEEKKATPRKLAWGKRKLSDEDDDEEEAEQSMFKNATPEEETTPKKESTLSKSAPKKKIVDTPSDATEHTIDHILACVDKDCGICDKFLVDLDIDPENLAHTLECPGSDCDECNREEQDGQMSMEGLEASEAQAEDQPPAFAFADALNRRDDTP